MCFELLPFLLALMSIQQHMQFQSGLLNVVASGEFSLEDAKQAFREILAAVAKYKAEKILFDAQNVKGQPEDLERFFYGEFAARETRKIVDEHKIMPHFAYVIHEPLRDPRSPGGNRGDQSRHECEDLRDSRRGF